jgi:hypothetical protein
MAFYKSSVLQEARGLRYRVLLDELLLHQRAAAEAADDPRRRESGWSPASAAVKRNASVERQRESGSWFTWARKISGELGGS